MRSTAKVIHTAATAVTEITEHDGRGPTRFEPPLAERLQLLLDDPDG